MKINSDNDGLIAFNNMIRIKMAEMVNFHIDKKITWYKSTLKRQFIFCNKNKQAIKQHAIDLVRVLVIHTISC